MVVVIIAGGSGTRLWPRSTSTKPKQFLEIDVSGRSLLQKTYDRVKDISDAVYIVTSAPIADETAQQLPEIKDNIVVEPSRKGVANALYLGLRRIKNDGYDESEPLFILWSDHLIHDQETFQSTVNNARTAIKSGTSKLVQFGIVPSYPSNQLGYIKKGSSSQDGKNIYEIDSWKYQPDQETANKWYESGNYLWNAGYFLSTAKYVLTEIKRESPQSYSEYESIMAASNDDIEKVYSAQEGAILDHVLSEKMKGAHVVACTFDWVDIGNFQDLHMVSKHDEHTNHIEGIVHVSDGVEDSYIFNQLDIPVAVVGLDNVAVVATEEGILVVNKSQSRMVGDVAKKIQS